MKTLVPSMTGLLLMIMSLTTQADCQPSWCKNAKTNSEIAVCKSELLRSADALMNLLYKSILNNDNVLMGVRGTVRGDQKDFLTLRDQIAYSEQGLQHIYIDRITTLQNTLKQFLPDI